MSASTQLPPALELRGIVKRFGQTLALDGVDFVLMPGEIHALLGENGAGKSTAMRIAYGLTAPDAGSVRLFGVDAAGGSVAAAVRSGLGMVHQHLSLVPTLTAAESLVLGSHGLFNRHEAETALRSVADASGLHVDPAAVVSELSVVEQQRLEILKALARNAKALILDEPTAVLAPSESDELLRWLRRFADGGGSVVLVTHKLREALAISDVITVLRRGRVVATADATSTTEAELARAMFPDASDGASTTPGSRGAVVVRMSNGEVRGARGSAIRAATIELHSGEMVGLAAIEGSGHRELLRALAGLTPLDAGTLELPSRIALIPGDRARDAVIGEFSLAENVALHGLGARRGLMPWQSIADRTQLLIGRFGIAAPGPEVSIRSLSGGNQQRLVVARELEHDVDLLIADNPTRGLDLRASAFVHEQLRSAAARGAAVVVHSSDLDEVLSLASRMFVVFDGAVQELSVDRDLVSRAMVGTAA